MNSNVTVQDVFNAFYDDYKKQYAVSAEQAKSAWSIMNCKTGAMGVNTTVCEECGSIQVHYNSCRNRCCPMCQELPTQKWIDARREDVLDAPYYHLVFTLPDELNPVIYSNQKLLYTALYASASETLEQLTADTKYLGAKIGYISILHTWGSAMNYHPHLHCIIFGGGLNEKNQWREKSGDFFIPVKVLSKVFRGKFMEKIKGFWQNNILEFHGSASKYRNYYSFKDLLDICYRKEWAPYCKPTFNGAQSVIQYLGKYTHRIAISNRRIIGMDEHTVTYWVKDYSHNGKWRQECISGVEFIRRFLMHIPPRRFVRIRHYGILGNRLKKKTLALCRILLGCKQYLSKLKEMDTAQILNYLYGIDVCSCKDCGGKLIRIPPQIALKYYVT